MLLKIYHRTMSLEAAAGRLKPLPPSPDHAPALTVLERRIASTLPPRDSADLSEAFPVIPHISEHSLAVKAEIPRIEPTRDQVVDQMKKVTAKTAVKARIDINQAYSAGTITAEARQQLEVDLDVNATPVMEAKIHEAPYRSRVRKVEGAKEKRKYGRVLPTIKPSLGFGELLKIEDSHRLADADGLGDVELVLDPIEGTRRATDNEEGATAMSGGSIKGGLPEIPGEEVAHYTDTKIAGPRVSRFMREVGIDDSIDLTATDLAYLTAMAFMVDIRDVEAIVLERERNQAEIDELTNLGVKLRLLPDGDLIPSLEILTEDRPQFSVGSGGKEEAALVYYATKVTDGYIRGSYRDKEGNRLVEYPEALTVDVMAPGNKEDYFVTFAAITDVPELGMTKTTETQEAGEGYYSVMTGTLTSESPVVQMDTLLIKAA